MTVVGDLDQRIELQRETQMPDGIGGITKSWATFDRVWAKVTMIRGGEMMSEGRMAATDMVRLTIRSREDVTALTRVVYRGEAYNVRSVPPYSRNQMMTILAERGVAS